MGYSVKDLRQSSAIKFERAKEYLLPIEEVRFVCQIQEGFLVLTGRRVVFLRGDKEHHYRIERVIPYDCLLEFEIIRDDVVRVHGIKLDQYGCHELVERGTEVSNVTTEFEIKAPRVGKGETKVDVKKHFHATVSHLANVVEEIKSSEAISRETPLVHDYSYLDDLPEILTRNVILDLNAVLQDRPVHDELLYDALKFLGNAPFLLEESLRDGIDESNGVLFAAGERGYIWIQGGKRGRFMTNVLVDKVEWNNIKCLVHRWQIEEDKIEIIHSLIRDSKEITKQYQWIPTLNEDTSRYPWLLQKLNGPWILADITFKYSGKPMPASWVNNPQLKRLGMHKQRYYY